MEESRTVFVAGLPKDVKERELHLLFRDQPGFLAVTLRLDNIGRPMGFANFEDHQAANNAIAALNDAVIDPSTGDRIRLELARSSSRSLAKRTRDGDAEIPPPKMSSVAKGPLVYSNLMPFAQLPMAAYRHADTPAVHLPNSTLFITGLGPHSTTAYITELLASFPGFDRVKVDNEGQHNACCFARFHGILEAQAAMVQLQGLALPTNSTLRCEYAKSDLGRKSSRADGPLAGGMMQPALQQTYHTTPSSTLFISGLGQTTSTADMTNLCQSFPGFERLKVDREGEHNACCFAKFQSTADAAYAMQHLAGHEMLSITDGRVVPLRCEFAKADLGAKSTPSILHRQYHQLDPYSFHGMALGPPHFGMPAMMPSPAANSTLFLAGLGPTATTEELQSFCTFLPGFERLKVDHEGQPRACAFALFSDPASAMAALTKLLQHPFKGRMLKVEFAKQDLGHRG